jgi:hypothetical protein
MCVDAVLKKAHTAPIGPTGRESLLLGYKALRGGFEDALAVGPPMPGMVRKGLCNNTSQSTDRIARTIFNVAVCRTFSRLVLLWLIDRHGMVTDRSRKYRPLIDRLEMRCFAGLSTPC